MMIRQALCVACVLGLGAVGCSKETTSSKDIKTGGIAALIDVYADTDDAATVHVELRVGGSSSNTYVDLEGGDVLKATAGDTTKELKVRDTGIYEASFSDVGEDTEFSVVLERPEDTTADSNSGLLPAPFSLDEPPSNLSRKDDDLDVTWAPANKGDPMHVAFDGDCIFDSSDSASDTGTYKVEAGSLDSTGGDKPETCDITVSVQRNRDGEADSEFDPESWFRLHQRRSASFTSAP
jgi:hypothetical protein